MIAFLDTEFTDLALKPRLLSVGIVAGFGGDREFYAETTDRDRLEAASWYALATVLPQFGEVAGAACTYLELGRRLSIYLGELASGIDRDEQIEIAFGYHLDWELVEQAMEDSSAGAWRSIRHRIAPVNVHDRTGFGAAKRAADAYFKSQAHAPFSRHHALCDARALRLAYLESTLDADRTIEPDEARSPFRKRTAAVEARLS